MFLHKAHVILLGLGGSCVMLSACGSDTSTGANSHKAAVRYVNAMTGGTGSLVFTTNGNTNGQTVAYQQSSSCQSLNPAATDFSVEQSGSSTALANLSGETLAGGGRYTVVAAGNTTLQPQLIFLNDTYTTPATGRGRIRVVNAVNTATPFDVYIGTPGSSLGTSSQSNLTYNTATSYIDVPAGLTQVTVTAPGTQTQLGTSANFTVNSGDVSTIVFTPATTNGGLLTSFSVPECP